MRHPRLRKWEAKLKKALDEIDDMLEDRFGKAYLLHPSRQKRGKTSNKSSDGLFDLTAKFTLGYCSEYGEGYLIDIHMSTLQDVEEDIRLQIRDLTFAKLTELVYVYFPEQELQVSLDGKNVKIHGNLDL